MTAPDFPTWAVIFSYKIWHPERELTTVQSAPFLNFIIDSRARIVKHKNTKEKAQKEMTAPIVFQTPAVMFLKMWHWERELTTVQPAPFLIFIIDSRARIVKHKDTKDKNGPPASAFSGCGGRPDIFWRILMRSDVFIRSLENNADTSFFLYFGVIFAF